MVSRINGKVFHHSSSFFINNKKAETNFTVKYIQQVHNFAVVPKPVPTDKPETCFICSESFGPLSFININISRNSIVF